ncbi:MAG: hypothetical protein KAH44_08345 [Oricola sp.]|jgi:hypothetical protein|nr:hypothetical protein [Oricola sp.]
MMMRAISTLPTRHTGRSPAAAPRRAGQAGAISREVPDIVITDVIMDAGDLNGRAARQEHRIAPPARQNIGPEVLRLVPLDAGACTTPRAAGAFADIVERVMRRDPVRSTILQRL